jgi:hypothetical protein
MQRQGDPRFAKLAVEQSPLAGFAAAFFSSFGISLFDAVSVVTAMVNAPKKYKVLAAQCITAAVQVRQNTSIAFVAESRDFSILTISSVRERTPDQLNFKAYHIIGHILLGLAYAHPIAMKANAKGNCVMGGPFPETPAGKINKEIYNGFAEADRRRFDEWTRSDEGNKAKEFAVSIIDALSDMQSKGFKKTGNTPKKQTPDVDEEEE